YPSAVIKYTFRPSNGPYEEDGFNQLAGFDLQLIPSLSDAGDISPEGKKENLIVVAEVNGVLHFRVFGGDGKVVVETDARRLSTPARQVFEADLKDRLEGLWPPRELTRPEKYRLIAVIRSILNHNTLAEVPVVCDWNSRFLDLFGLAGWR